MKYSKDKADEFLESLPSRYRRARRPDLDIPARLNLALIDAIRASDLRTAKDAIRSGADINYKDVEAADRTALHWAISNGDRRMYTFLARAGARFDIQDCYEANPLDYAWELARAFIKPEFAVYAERQFRRLRRYTYLGPNKWQRRVEREVARRNAEAAKSDLAAPCPK